VLLGSILDDAVGDKAKKKIARRRADMISGNIHSYARALNNPEQLEMLKEHVDLYSIIADITADRDDTRKKQSEDKRTRQAAALAKKTAAAEKDKQKQVELLPGMEIDVAKGLEHVLKLSVSRKKNIAKYMYGITVGLAKMKNEELDAFLREEMEDDLVSANETTDNSTTVPVLHSTTPSAGAMLEEP
jgi:hypothetical protein